MVDLLSGKLRVDRDTQHFFGHFFANRQALSKTRQLRETLLFVERHRIINRIANIGDLTEEDINFFIEKLRDFINENQ